MELKNLNYELKVKKISNFLLENVKEAKELKEHFATQQDYNEAAKFRFLEVHLEEIKNEFEKKHFE